MRWCIFVPFGRLMISFGCFTSHRYRVFINTFQIKELTQEGYVLTKRNTLRLTGPTLNGDNALPYGLQLVHCSWPEAFIFLLRIEPGEYGIIECYKRSQITRYLR